MKYSLTATDQNALDYVIANIEKSFAIPEDSLWESHEVEIRSWSEKFKGVIFTLDLLTSDGSESIKWRKFFLNGKMQISVPEIVIPAFDTDLLK